MVSAPHLAELNALGSDHGEALPTLHVVDGRQVAAVVLEIIIVLSPVLLCMLTLLYNVKYALVIFGVGGIWLCLYLAILIGLSVLKFHISSKLWTKSNKFLKFKP